MITEKKLPVDYISPLIINGLHGRVMYIAAKKPTSKREILLLYGHHSALERMFGIVQNMSTYGSVTMPDLPGFGGMDSFYTIHEKPNLDAMADYLATFIKLRYKKRPITIGAMSYGFVIVTKMLQKYPALVDQVELLVSMVGFTHKNDFKLSAKRQFIYRNSARLFTGYIGSKFVRYVALQPIFIKSTYKLQANSHAKMKGANKEELKQRLDFEVFLWHANDVRTYMYTSALLLTVDIVDIKVDLPVHHIAVDADQYFDNRQVKKHLSKVYNSVTMHKAHMPNHAPTVISDAKEAAAFIPKDVRKILAKKPKQLK